MCACTHTHTHTHNCFCASHDSKSIQDRHTAGGSRCFINLYCKFDILSIDTPITNWVLVCTCLLQQTFSTSTFELDHHNLRYSHISQLWKGLQMFCLPLLAEQLTRKPAFSPRYHIHLKTLLTPTLDSGLDSWTGLWTGLWTEVLDVTWCKWLKLLFMGLDKGILDHVTIHACSKRVVVHEGSVSYTAGRNPIEIQKSKLKSRNPFWYPEIQTEIQKSNLKSRNPLWNPEIHSEIPKSNSGYY